MDKTSIIGNVHGINAKIERAKESLERSGAKSPSVEWTGDIAVLDGQFWLRVRTTDTGRTSVGWIFEADGYFVHRDTLEM